MFKILLKSVKLSVKNYYYFRFISCYLMWCCACF